MSFPSPDRQPLARTDLDPDPIKQFGAWFGAAGEIVVLPEAMTLATVDEAGRPDAAWFCSRATEPTDSGSSGQTTRGQGSPARCQRGGRPGLLLAPQDRQVRVRGPVRRLDADASDRYFASRDRRVRSAPGLPQSQPIPDQREALEELAEAAADRFAEGEVPRPPHWGGFILEPRSIEFWQGRGARLHDRFRYDRQDSGEGWRITRLAP